MDPVTQGALGGVAAQVVCGRALPRSAWLIGTAAGLAADLDILIRPAMDPLGGQSFHRHFTHSLAFIPVGTLLCALPFLLSRRFAGKRWLVLLAAFIGYATHGLLDACTAYGTLLLWPFTNARVAFDWIGIVDPVYTALLLAGLIWSVRRRQPRWAVAALGFSTLYMGLGAMQHGRAVAVQRELAATRGQEIVHGRTLPTPLNLVVWRSVYEADGRIYADAIRLPLFAAPAVRPGASTPLVTADTLAARGPLSDEARAVFERFRWFADGFTAYDSAGEDIVGDMRYGVRPEVFASLWGLRLPPPGEPSTPHFEHLGLPGGNAASQLWHALVGEDRRYQPLAVVLAQHGP